MRLSKAKEKKWKLAELFEIEHNGFFVLLQLVIVRYLNKTVHCSAIVTQMYILLYMVDLYMKNFVNSNHNCYGFDQDSTIRLTYFSANYLKNYWLVA